MSATLLIESAPGEVRGALIEEGRVVELRIERLGQGSRVGNIHYGRVLRLLPELPAALIDIGDERPAFLSAEDAADLVPAGDIAALHDGQAILVAVKRDAQGEKAVGLTARLRIAGRLLALTPTRARLVPPRDAASEEKARLAELVTPLLEAGEGAILTAEAIGADAPALTAELALLRRRWQALREAAKTARPPALLATEATPLTRLLASLSATPLAALRMDDRAAFAEARAWLEQKRPDLAGLLAFDGGGAPLFERQGVAEAVETAAAPRISLPGGGALTIEATTAMTVIDVDSGTGASGRGGARQASLAVNLTAAREAARQLRLRNIAGAVIIDFVSMRRREDRDTVLAELKAACARDPAAPQLLGWTRLGHVELTRPRGTVPLAEILGERSPGGGWRKSALTLALAALRAVAREAEAQPGARFALRAPPEIWASLAGPAVPALAELETRLARPVIIEPDTALAREAFDIRRL